MRRHDARHPGGTRLGTATERATLEHSLNARYGLVRPPASTTLLPTGWCETESIEGESILIPDPVARRLAVRLPFVAFVVALVAAGYFIKMALQHPGFWSRAWWSIPFVGLTGWATASLAWTQPEWVLSRGRLTFQRRFRERKWQRFEAGAIELVENRDSESGRSYDLIAISIDAPATEKGRRKYRRNIAGDSELASMRSLGQWLSERCQIPFTDTSTGVQSPTFMIHV